MENYNDEWQRRHNDLCCKHEQKLNAAEKAGNGSLGLLTKLFLYLSIITTIAAYVVLVMVPFYDVELLHAACLFVIGYIMEKSSTSWSNAAMAEVGAKPADYMGHIIAHNQIIGEDIREIKNLLKSRGERE